MFFTQFYIQFNSSVTKIFDFVAWPWKWRWNKGAIAGVMKTSNIGILPSETTQRL